MHTLTWRWTPTLLALPFFLVLGVKAQVIGCQQERECWWAGQSCTVVTNWLEEVDLDQDQALDLLHANFIADFDCYQVPPTIHSFWEWTEDLTEAYLPAEHVELYGRVFQQFEGAQQHLLTLLLTNGQHLPATTRQPEVWPRDGWTWTRWQDWPRLRTVGLGITIRGITSGPCRDICRYYSESIGYLDRTNTTGLFGFRLPQLDGWHLGWLRLVLDDPWPWPTTGKVVGVRLAEYALHPDPDTPLLAGQPPQPRLRAERVGHEVVISWARVWTGYKLERTRTLSPPAWEPVLRVADNRVTIPAQGGPWYYRLRKSD